MTDLLLRAITQADFNFVKSTWLKNFKEHSDFARPIKNSIYFLNHAAVVDRLLTNSDTVIASHVDEPDVILGFLVSDATCIHYAYVISKARRLGIGSAMLRHANISHPFSYSHRTEDAESLSQVIPGMIYDPYKI